MRKFLFILLLAMILPALTLSAAYAAGGKIRFGNLAFVPSLGVDEVHDDNIYYDKHNKESDWITHIRPGLMLDYTIEGRGKFKFGYRGDYAYYAHNNDNNWKKHLLFLDLDYLSPGGLIVKINNNLVHSEDPYGGLNDYKLGEQSERWTNALKTAVGYKFSDRFKLLGFYNYYRQDYKNNGNGVATDYNGNPAYYYGADYDQDYYYNEAGLGVEAKVAHKTWAFLRYHNGSQSYFTHRDGVTGSNDASYDWQRVNTGLAWDDGGRFGGELNLGYQWNDHQNSYDRNGFRYKDHDNWIAATRITFRQTEGRAFYFLARRQMYQLNSGVSGYYLDTHLELGVRQKIKSKFLYDLAFIYGKNKYESEGSSPDYSYSDSRRDTVYGLRTGLKYQIREWLIAGIEYYYVHNDSNDSYAGYKINRLRFSIDFKPADYH